MKASEAALLAANHTLNVTIPALRKIIDPQIKTAAQAGSVSILNVLELEGMPQFLSDFEQSTLVASFEADGYESHICPAGLLCDDRLYVCWSSPAK